MTLGSAIRQPSTPTRSAPHPDHTRLSPESISVAAPQTSSEPRGSPGDPPAQDAYLQSKKRPVSNLLPYLRDLGHHDDECKPGRWSCKNRVVSVLIHDRALWIVGGYVQMLIPFPFTHHSRKE